MVADALAVARVEHEFALIRRLEQPGVIRALALERSGAHLVLVLEAHRGVDLGQLLRHGPLPLDRFSALAIELARILAEVHEQRIVHRDIKPTNILVDPDSGAIALADFGISLLLESERGRIHDREVLTGTLPYMAPEQSGRTAREVDFRSDLYSLGATFYEALTGRRPFEADTPLELVHAHLARKPIAPQRVRPELPTPLSELVMKLLEKAPERRYQSARGLWHDLVALRESLSRGTAEQFELGRHDVPSSLRLPHQLYGREAERASLLAAFRQALDGQPRLALVVGPAGIGKTSLVGELLEPLLAHRGMLARGHFEGGSEQPFSALITALHELADQLLSEPPETLLRWRASLRAELGGLVGALVELVPAFGRVLAVEGASSPRTPLEARNQAMLAGVRVLQVFARAEHPLVLILDDAEAADPATIDLLDTVFGEGEAHLLVVIVGHERALEPSRKLAALCTKLDARGQAPTHITLLPLGHAPLVQLIADMLGAPPERVAPLAELVARKTGGNPSFVGQLLLHLADRQLLRREPAGWTWDLAALEAAGLPDDLLDMMMDKLGRLAPPLLRVLELASVIGETFEPALLARVAPDDDVPAALLRAHEAGLIGPRGRVYAFEHARIRAAALAMLDADERTRLELELGRALLDELEPGELDVRVFEVVEHLDRGHRLLDGDAGDVEHTIAALPEPERERLVDLNLRAARRALASGAPRSAATYIEVVQRLLATLGEFPRPGAPRHAAFVAFELLAAQVEALTQRSDAADARLAVLLERELDIAELGAAGHQRCWTLALAGRIEDALDHANTTLRRLGVAVPRSPGSFHMLRALVRMTRLLRSDALERVVSRPPITDARVLAALRVFMIASNVSYVASPALFVTHAALHAELLLEQGSHPSAPLVFSQISLILAGALGWQAHALAVSRRCLELAAGSPLHYKVANSANFIALWSSPFLPLVDAYDGILAGAMEQGDITAAETAWTVRTGLSTYGGRHLRLLESEVEQRLRWTQTWGTLGSTGGGPEVIAACRRLSEGPAPRPDELDPLGVLSPAPSALHVRADYTLLSALVLAVFGCWSSVMTLLDPLLPELEHKLPRTWYIAMACTLHGVAAAEQAHASEGPTRSRALARLATDARKAARWTKRGGNLSHVAALLAGELARARGQLERAMQQFAAARQALLDQHNPIYEALIGERFAAALLAAGHDRAAIGPLLDARDAYERWGAFAKLAQLDAAAPELARRNASGNASGGDEHTTSSSGDASNSHSTTSKAIDSATLLRASQTLAEDIRLEEVIDRVMSIALQSAGAQRGVLVLADEGRLALVAEASSESGTLTHLDKPIPLAQAHDKLPTSLLHWVERTSEAVVLDVDSEHRFQNDPYLREHPRGSFLCVPFVKRGRLVGLLYLENRLSAGAFLADRLELLRLLTAQVASALENGRLYADLRRSEIRWRSLIEQLPDFVVIVDRERKLEFINVPDRGGRERVLPEHLAGATTTISRVFQQGTRERIELAAHDAKGEVRWYAIRAAPLIVDGRVEKVLVVATDVSERKQAERQREQLEGQLRQQQRLESIGTLASGVAHEINNPVQGIMNYAELIAGAPAADAEIREFAGEITAESKRVTTIVRNLLAFSRQELSEADESVSLASIVEGTLSLIRAVLRRDQIMLDVDIPDTLPLVEVRSQQIQQVVMNLVTNARDAINATGVDEADRRIRIDADTFAHEGRAWVRLSVEDRGGGVPPEALPHIFDPFFTTKGRDQGTGLGLAVSHGIVTEHGGRLVLANKPGIGARFSIELPLAPESSRS
jgi:predicted ATPase/signal transduction histidine kinase/tRNA A-37 threonylcarbamoyl transferase component Bud32